MTEQVIPATFSVDHVGPSVRDLDSRRRFFCDCLGWRVTGTVRMALSAIVMAFWDALAQSFGPPPSHLLGGSPRPLPACDSRGLGLTAPAALADEAEKLLAKGLRALKLRLG